MPSGLARLLSSSPHSLARPSGRRYRRKSDHPLYRRSLICRTSSCSNSVHQLQVAGTLKRYLTSRTRWAVLTLSPPPLAPEISQPAVIRITPPTRLWAAPLPRYGSIASCSTSSSAQFLGKGPGKDRGVRGKARKDHSERLPLCKDVSYSQAFSGKGTTVVVCMPSPDRAKAIQGLAST